MAVLNSVTKNVFEIIDHLEWGMDGVRILIIDNNIRKYSSNTIFSTFSILVLKTHNSGTSLLLLLTSMYCCKTIKKLSVIQY